MVFMPAQQYGFQFYKNRLFGNKRNHMSINYGKLFLTRHLLTLTYETLNFLIKCFIEFELVKLIYVMAIYLVNN